MSFIGIDDRGGVDDRLNPRTKRAADITLTAGPGGVAVTSDGKTAFVANTSSGTVSTIDVKTRKKEPHRHHRRLNTGPSRSRPTARPPSSPTTAAAPCRRLM
jgi:DNA-binding beta-propeller fold protein YncE